MKHLPRPVSFALLPLLGLGGCAALGGDSGPVVTNDTRMNVAMAAEASGDTESAIRLYSLALAKEPNNPDIAIKYARALISARQISLARELLSRKLGERPGQPDLAREFATIQVLQGQPQEAVAGFDLALKANPKDVRSLVNKGIALDMLGRHADAQGLYRQADALSPDDPTVRSNLAMSLMLHGQIAEASQVLQALPASATMTPRMRNNMAVIAAANGDFAQAHQLTQGQISDTELRQLVSRLPVTNQPEAPNQGRAVEERPLGGASPAGGTRARRAKTTASPAADAQPAMAVSAGMAEMRPAGATVPAVKTMPLTAAPIPAAAPVVPAPALSQAPVATGQTNAAGAIPLTVPEPNASARSGRPRSETATGTAARAASAARVEQTPATRARGEERAEVARSVAASQGEGWRAPSDELNRPGTIALFPLGKSEPLSLSGPRIGSQAGPKGYSVQFASVPSQAAAEGEWRRLAARLAARLSGREATFAEGSRPDGSPIWRVRTGGFGSHADAAQFCADVKQVGQDCIVVRHAIAAAPAAPMVTGTVSPAARSPAG